MPIHFKASANVDLCVDGEAAMALYQSLQQSSSLQNLLDTLIINGSSKNNIDVTFDPKPTYPVVSIDYATDPSIPSDPMSTFDPMGNSLGIPKRGQSAAILAASGLSK